MTTILKDKRRISIAIALMLIFQSFFIIPNEVSAETVNTVVTVSNISNNQPISGAVVELYQNGLLVATQTTSSLGKVTFTGLNLQGYSVKVVKVGYADYNSSLPAGTTEANIMMASNNVTGSGTTITGVYNDNGSITWTAKYNTLGTYYAVGYYMGFTLGAGLGAPQNLTLNGVSSSFTLKSGTYYEKYQTATSRVNTVTFTTNITNPNLDFYTVTSRLGDGLNRDVGTATATVVMVRVKSINPVTSIQNTVTGTATPGSYIQLKDSGGNIIGEGLADSAGNFTAKLSSPQPAGSIITVESVYNGQTAFMDTTVIYPDFDQNSVVSWQIGNAPKMYYVEGESSDFSQTRVILKDINGVALEVSYADFGNYGIILNPENATVLTEGGYELIISKSGLPDLTIPGYVYPPGSTVQPEGGYDPEDNINHVEYTTDGSGTYPKYYTQDGTDLRNNAYRQIEYTDSFVAKWGTQTEIPGRHNINIRAGGKTHGMDTTTDVVIVLDHSGSMSSSDIKFNTTKDATSNFISSLLDSTSGKTRIGEVIYSDYSKVVGFSTDKNYLIGELPQTKNSTIGRWDSATAQANGSVGAGTFTQDAIRKAGELLDASTADNKIMVVITDGMPTYSYRVDSLRENPFGFNIGSADRDPTPYLSSIMGISGTQRVGYGAATYLTTPGYNAALYNNGNLPGLSNNPPISLSPGMGSPVYDFNYKYGNQSTYERVYSYNMNSNSLSTQINSHGYATISEAVLQKEKGYSVYSVGVDLTNLDIWTGYYNVTLNDINTFLSQISSNDGSFDPDKYFYNTANLSEVNEKLSAISQSILSDTIVNGTITDPIGEMVDLNLGTDGVFNKEDYKLIASDGTYLGDDGVTIYKSDGTVATESLLQGVSVNYDISTRTITITGLYLGEGEWVDLKYDINLRTEDASYAGDFYYQANGTTTLDPKSEITEDGIRYFPVPSVKGPNISVLKLWTEEVPAEIQEITVDIYRNGTMIKEGVKLLASEGWSKSLTDLAPYDNYGDAFDYTVVETNIGLNSGLGNYEATYEYNSGEMKLTVTNTKKIPVGYINIKKMLRKYDTNQNMIGFNGVQFELRKSNQELNLKDGVLVGTATTSNAIPINQAVHSDGVASFNELSDGYYYLKEIYRPDAPIGTQYSTPMVEAFIKIENGKSYIWQGGQWLGEEASGEYHTVTCCFEIYNLYENIKYPLTLNKVDTENNLIITDSAEFKIYKEGDYIVNPMTGLVEINQYSVPIAVINTGTVGTATTESLFSVGKYALVETKNPSKYLGITAPIIIELTSDSQGNPIWNIGDGYGEYANILNNNVQIVNDKLEYPSTGGIGSIIFIVAGVIIMGAVLAIKKRKS